MIAVPVGCIVTAWHLQIEIQLPRPLKIEDNTESHAQYPSLLRRVS
jgi:hypothetical protein